MAALPAPVSVEVACTLLTFVPAVAPTTLTVTLQEPFASKAPPVRLIEPDPVVAETLPPQLSVQCWWNPPWQLRCRHKYVVREEAFADIHSRGGVLRHDEIR